MHLLAAMGQWQAYPVESARDTKKSGNVVTEFKEQYILYCTRLDIDLVLLC